MKAMILTCGVGMSKICQSASIAVDVQVRHASSGMSQGIPCIHGPGSVSVALLMPAPGATLTPEGTCRTCVEYLCVCVLLDFYWGWQLLTCTEQPAPAFAAVLPACCFLTWGTAILVSVGCDIKAP
jgi:hypothetical protein